jgi:hypothetical protein
MCLGIDVHSATEQAKVGRQLIELPAIVAAATAGEVGWSTTTPPAGPSPASSPEP